MSIGAILVGRLYPQMQLRSIDGAHLVEPVGVLLVAAFSLGLLS